MDDKKKLNAEAAPTSQTMEQLSAELAKVRKKASHFDAHAMWSDKELQAHQRELRFMRRKVRNLFFASAALGVILVAGTAWTYSRIEASDAVLTALPDPTDLVRAADAQADAFARQLEGLGEQLASLSADGEIIDGYGDRITALEEGTGGTLDELKARVEQDARVEAQVRLDTAQRIDEMNPRLEAVETFGTQATEELRALEQDIERMRSEVAGELALLKFGNSEVLESVEGRLAGTERGLEAVSWEVGRERLDFELFEDYRLEVAPGIVLNVTDTDVGYQRVNGWIHLVNDGRVLRLANHPIQQALVFYGADDERSYELVFTRVRPDVAIGYVRVPDDDGVRIVNHVRDAGFADQASIIR